AGAGGRRARGGAAGLVQPRLHEGHRTRRPARAQRPADGRRARLQLQLRRRRARWRPLARNPARAAVLALGGAPAPGADVAPHLERARRRGRRGAWRAGTGSAGEPVAGKWKNTGAANTTESIRSIIPPWPSIMWPQSLAPRLRLTAD